MAWKGWRPAPLPSSFMLMSILGFTISALWVFPRDNDLGFTFLLLFTLMFVASVISMTHASSKNLEALDARAEHRHSIFAQNKTKQVTSAARKRKRATRRKKTKRAKRPAHRSKSRRKTSSARLRRMRRTARKRVKRKRRR
jgi:hypothetical protein